METTFKVKWRPFGYHFEDGWRPIIKLSVVSSNIGSNNFGLRKMALLFLNLASLSLIFNLYKVYKNQNYNLSNIKEYSIIVCWKAEFCSFSYEMLRISKGKETLTLKGDHLETNFQGFYQKSLHWRPRSPMETSVHNPAIDFLKFCWSQIVQIIEIHFLKSIDEIKVGTNLNLKVNSWLWHNSNFWYLPTFK